MADSRWIGCGLSIAHPWLCDIMGHMATRHYAAMFEDAAYHLSAAFGGGPELGRADGWGWADVRHETVFQAEVAAGTRISIEGRVTKLGRSSITTELRMFADDADRPCATLTASTVCFDLNQRKSRAIPDDVRVRAAALFDLSAE